MLCVETGLSFKEASELDPLTRQAIIYWKAVQNGCRIDWKTGAIKAPKG
jgi:hypothetical protein